jgi:hypothetical protein
MLPNSAARFFRTCSVIIHGTATLTAAHNYGIEINLSGFRESIEL